MKFALCNEMFGERPHDEVFAAARDLGYTGVEIAPFTLDWSQRVADVRKLSPAQVDACRTAAERAGVEIVGLHWLLAKTEGFYLTHPEAAIRNATASYLAALATLCADLGGHVMVLGSPQQRNLLPGVTHAQAMQWAAEVLVQLRMQCERLGVTIAIEPLGPAEGDFLNTARSAIELCKLVNSPRCRLHLDVKAMSSETAPIDSIVRDSAAWIEHFHANDPNLLGPGMGAVDFAPIFAALGEVGYQRWVSVEVFKYEPSPTEIARQSIEYMRQFV
jgi:sugar phosphate isomerase/epimerase